MGSVLTKDVKRLQQDVQGLQQKSAKLEEALQQNEEWIKTLDRESVGKGDVIRQLRSDVAAKDRNIAQLTSRIEQIEGEMQQPKDAERRLREEKESLERLLQQRDDAIERLQTVQQEQQEIIQGLTTKMREQDALLTWLIEAKTKLQKQLEAQTKTTAELRNVTAVKETKIAQLKEDLGQRERLIVDLTTQVAELQSEVVGERETKIVGLERHLLEIGTDRDELVSKLEQAKARIKELEHRLAHPVIKFMSRFIARDRFRRQPHQ